MAYYNINKDNELNLAVKENNIFKINKGLTKGANINFLNPMSIEITDFIIEDYNSTFHLACWLGKKDIIELLLNSGADIHLKLKI
jgi:ankyrin repeat protein